MSDIGLGYLGRVVGVGYNKDKPFAIYAVTGRSEMSKARMAEILDNNIVRIAPSGEISDDQKKMRDLIFYNAMRIADDPSKIVISNGMQTEHTIRALKDRVEKYPHAIAEGFIRSWGAEPDKLRTPRVTGILDSSANAALGIVTKEGMASRLVDIRGDNSVHFLYVSTYLGSCGGTFGPTEHKNSGVEVPTGRIDIHSMIPMDSLDICGDTSQKIADNFYDYLADDLRVSTAAALWDQDLCEWRLSKRNLHE